MYCYVWEYEVRGERQSTFENAYGPEGEWVQLFQRDPGYVRTILLRGRESRARFVTVDFWTSREAFQAFRERFRTEFEALDERFEALTRRETYLGDFDIVK
jgi:heme-degrading monooxygenase HmoA